MGKNSKAGKLKKIKLTEEQLREVKRRFTADTKREWNREAEHKIQKMFKLAEEIAFIKNMYVALMANHDLFGHGKQRLERMADYMLSQYDSIEKGYVTIKDIVDTIRKETGAEIKFSDEEKQLAVEMGIMIDAEGSKQ